jgi:hypothetical protein
MAIGGVLRTVRVAELRINPTLLARIAAVIPMAMAGAKKMGKAAGSCSKHRLRCRRAVTVVPIPTVMAGAMRTDKAAALVAKVLLRRRVTSYMKQPITLLKANIIFVLSVAEVTTTVACTSQSLNAHPFGLAAAITRIGHRARIAIV